MNDYLIQLLFTENNLIYYFVILLVLKPLLSYKSLLNSFSITEKNLTYYFSISFSY